MKYFKGYKMAHEVKIWELGTDNSEKVYLVKYYSSSRCWYLNQLIKGKQFFKRWERCSAKYARTLIGETITEGYYIDKRSSK